LGFFFCSAQKLLTASDENDSALSWVEKSRKLEEEKKRASERVGKIVNVIYICIGKLKHSG